MTPLNNGHYFWVQSVVAIHRFDYTPKVDVLTQLWWRPLIDVIQSRFFGDPFPFPFFDAFNVVSPLCDLDDDVVPQSLSAEQSFQFKNHFLKSRVKPNKKQFNFLYFLKSKSLH